MSKWSIKKAREVYNISNWSDGFFDIDDSGKLVYCDHATGQQKLPFPELVQKITEAGLRLPVLVRFSGILRDRLRQLIAAFDLARKSLGYKNKYTVIYPVKVNQQRSVVKALLDFGGDRIGLEAGSKSELLAVMSLMPPEGVIVCNGYKDREFIELATAATVIGFRVYVVIEKLSELDLFVQVAQETGVKVSLGLRVRLSSVGSGNWQNSGGDKSKFGLASSEVMAAIAKIKSANLDDRLDMIHFHMGSQIANLEDINRGLKEASQFYVQCSRLAGPVRIINVGGGLGVDYEGTRSRSYFSKNYNSEDYARTVTESIQAACARHKLPEPEIFSESGRALTAHHAVLVTNVLEVEQLPEARAETAKPPVENDAPDALVALMNLFKNSTSPGVSETFSQAGQLLAALQADFCNGAASLQQRADGEKLYVSICQALRDKLKPDNRRHREVLDQLNEKLVDKYFCNFSVFQSVPDVWAMQQIFPIMPVQRLNDCPGRRGVVVDVTCDSDGRIDHYVDNEGVEASLPLHEISTGEEYLVAIFLVGAYQEILGDMHNLFGDTSSVHVDLTENNKFQLSEIIHGDTASSVLKYVHYDADLIFSTLGKKINTSVDLDSDRKKSLVATIRRGLDTYTYLK